MSLAAGLTSSQLRRAAPLGWDAHMLNDHTYYIQCCYNFPKIVGIEAPASRAAELTPTPNPSTAC